jgi:lipopolysaccharide biosynthesis protein
MKHLKTFKGINESTSGECDFETFKEIMFEITDEFDDVEFNDYSETDYFYDCWINLSSKFRTHDDFNMSFDYLADIIEPYDSPDNIKYILEDDKIYNHINSYLDKLHEIKSNIDNFILANEEVLRLFKNIEDFILPRFQTFSNFVQTDIGVDDIGQIRITFEMEERE